MERMRSIEKEIAGVGGTNTMSIDIAKRQTTKTYYFLINNMGLS